MLVQVDFYKETGKWGYGGRVEIDKMPWEDGVLEEILIKQNIVLRGCVDFFIVLSDIPESESDPNYRMTYSRLIDPAKVKRAHQKILEQGGYED